MKTAKQEYYEKLQNFTSRASNLALPDQAEVMEKAISLATAAFEYGRECMKESYERNR